MSHSKTPASQRNFKMSKATREDIIRLVNVSNLDEMMEVYKDAKTEELEKDESWKAISNLVYEAIGARKTMEEFAAEILKDPNHAFEWGEQAVKRSGLLKLANEVKWQVINREKWNWEDAFEYLKDRMIDEASYGAPSSTSKMSNIAEEAYREARARFVRTVLEGRK